jgi:hypothetical protein
MRRRPCRQTACRYCGRAGATTHLLKGEIGGQLFIEPLGQHATDNGQARLVTRVELGLVQQTMGAVGTAGGMSVEPLTLLTGETNEAIIAGQEFHSGGSDACARTKKQS